MPLSEMWVVTCMFLTEGTLSLSAVSSWKCVANRQKDLILVAMSLKKKFLKREI